MTIGSQGENLIFIISQPRAGSTLLQLILGSHPHIHTMSEPWIMLHPLYALRQEGYQAEYGENLARIAVRDFFEALPMGEEKYIKGLRRTYAYLYEHALESSGKRYFLDKTPRYYFIIPELSRIFPKASYIVLFRNPLAVLCSILKIWVKGSWPLLYGYKNDLIRAPGLLCEGIRALGKQCVVVYYEKLVRNPESELQRICNTLGVEFLPKMITYGHHDLSNWSFGDQEGAHEYSRPAPENAEKWVQMLVHPQIWRLANEYLLFLGRETVDQMGYSYDELRQILEINRPPRVSQWSTFSLAWLLRQSAKEHKILARRFFPLIMSLRWQGVRGMAVAALRGVASALSNPG